MPRWSERVDIPGIGVVHLCGSKPRARHCSTAGCRRAATIQCDYPVTRSGKPGTCDRHLCESCATNVGPDRDLCLPHARAWDSE